MSSSSSENSGPLVVFSGLPGFQSKSMEIYASVLIGSFKSFGEHVIEKQIRLGRWLSWARPRFLVQILLRYCWYPAMALATGWRYGARATYYVTDHANAWILCFLPKKSKKIVTLHDLAGIKPVSEFLFDRGLRGRVIWLLGVVFKKPGLRRADALVAVSGFTKAEARRFLGIPDIPITVVHNGVDHHLFSPGDRGAAKRDLGLDQRTPVVLTVSHADPRKNLRLALESVHDLQSSSLEGITLLHVGQLSKADRDWIVRHGLDQRVRSFAGVSAEKLRLCYQAADVFTHPSYYEGFGLPLIEAMACGCPVVYAATSALPEVAGDAGLPFSDPSREALATALERVLTDPALAASLSRKGLRRAAEFSWDKCAMEVLAVIRGVK